MIITDEEFLRQLCFDVLPEEVDSLREQLEKGLAYAEKIGNPGIGIAANQIGIRKKMAIIRLGKGLDLDLVNCHIANQHDPFYHYEGCLSLPGKTFKVKRYREVHVVNNLVEPKNFVATDLLAVAVQHELGHLSGQLVSDIAIPELPKVKVRPNDPCICGKPIKYKKCCGKFK